MTKIHLFLADNEQIDVVEVVELLSRHFPGTSVTAQNSFEAEREKAIATIAEIAQTGRPLKNPQLILQSITNKEARMGPGIDVMVPIGLSTVLHGYIWRKHAMLFTSQPVSDNQLDLIHTFFNSLGVGTIQTAKSD